MSKAEERSKIYAIHKASEKLHDYYGLAMLSVVQFDGNDIKNAYKEGYHQAEKDLSDQARKAVEIARKEVIEKAIKWVEYNNENGGCKFDGWVENIKQAMKDGTTKR